MTSKKSKLMLLIVFLALTYSSMAATVVVDPSIYPTNSTSGYAQNLYDAYTQIANQSTYQLQNSGSNMIVMKKTAAFEQQMAPFILSSSSVTGSLLITFEEHSPTINSVDDCSQLPTITLTSNIPTFYPNLPFPYTLFNNSVMQISSLSNFTLNGVNLKIHGDGNNAVFTAINYVGLSNICVQDLNPQNSSNFAVLTISSVTTVPIFNILFNRATNGSIAINNVNALTLTSVSVMLQNYNFTYPHLLAQFTTTSSTPTIFVSNFQTSCASSSAPILSPILLAAAVGTVNMTGFILANCTFIGSATYSGYYGNVLLEGMKTVNVTNTTVSNVVLSLQNTTTQTSNTYALYTLAGIFGLYMKNVFISNLTATAYTQDISTFGLIQRYYLYPLSFETTTIKNITIENSVSTGALNILYLSNDNFIHPIANLIIEWFNVFNCNFTGSTLIIFSLSPRSEVIRVRGVTEHQLNRFNVTNSVLVDTYLVSYSQLDTDLTVYANESIRISMDGVVLSNNVFQSLFGANVVQMGGSQLLVQNLTMTNNTFTNVVFFSNVLRMASFFLINSTFTNNSLTGGSYMVGYLLPQTLYRVLEDDFYFPNDSLKAETRPFMLVNCVFSNIYLQNSYLLGSRNPMIVLQNNTFSHITLVSSMIGSFNSYTAPTKLSPGNTFEPSPYVENEIFTNFNNLESIFHMGRALFNQAADSALFFLAVTQNTFAGIVSSGGTSVIQVDDATKYIAITSNAFSNASISGTDQFSLFELTDANYTIFSNNSINGMTGSSYLLSMSSDSILGYLSLSSNQLVNLMQTAGYSIQAAICGNISIGQESFSDSSIENTWIDMLCIQSAGKITLQQLSFQRINISGVPSRVTTINFISIMVQTNVFANNVLTVADSFFSNITFNKSQQGFIQGVFTSPMFIFTLSWMNLVFSNNTLQNLVNLPSDKILSISSPNINFTNSSFANLTFFDSSGGISMLFNTAYIQSCNFTSNNGSNSYSGGLLDILNPQNGASFNLTIDNCLFLNNTGPKVSLLNVESPSINLLVTNSHFSNNIARLPSSLIALNNLVSSNVIFQNTNLNSTIATPQTYGGFIQLVNALNAVYLEFDNVSLIMNSILPGSFLTIENGQSVTLNISNFSFSSTSTFAGQSFNSTYGLLDIDSSNSSIYNLTVSNINISSQALFQISCPANVNSTFNLSNSNFSNLTLENNILSVYSQTQFECSQTLLITNSDFYLISSGQQPGGGIVGSYGAPLLGLNISSNNFSKISSTSGGIYYGSPPLVFVNNNVLNTAASNQGGIIYGTGFDYASASRRILSQETASNFAVIGNVFSNITATDGGIFYSSLDNNQTGLILQQNSISYINTTDKGAICLVNNSALNITGNKFYNLIAGTDGSFVYWTQLNMNFTNFESNNIFVNQSPSVDFNPNRLLVEISQKGSLYTVTYDSDLRLTLGNLTTDSITDINFNVTLKYLDSQVNLKPDKNYSSKSTLTLTFNYKNNESDVFTTNNCADSSCLFNIGSDSGVALAGQKGDIFPVQMILTSDDFQVIDYFQISLRGCVLGEINVTSSETCFECSPGSYSLNLTDPSCLTCPAGAVCPGGSEIIVQNGYWSLPNAPNEVVQCKNISSGGSNNSIFSYCLGGQGCLTGYTGPSCQQCDIASGYLSDSSGSCSLCESTEKVITYGILYLLGGILYQLYVLYTASSESKKRLTNDEETNIQKVLPGSYVMIIVTYTQLYSVIKKLDTDIFSWVPELSTVLSTFATQNTPTTTNFQCLYLNKNPNADAEKVAQETEALKLFLFVFSPVAKLFYVFLFELIKGLVRKNEKLMSKKIFTRIGMTAIVLTTLEQPGIIGALCDYLTCSTLNTIDNTSYVDSNTLISCESPSYILYRNALVIPALIVWGFLVPFSIVLVLWIKRKKLYDSDILLTIFGGIYSKYTKKTFYWGIATIFFKICVFVCSSVIPDYTNGVLKGIVILILIHIYFGLLVRTNPYVIKGVNRAEGFMMMAMMTCITLILIKNSNSLTSSAIDNCIDAINILIAVFLIVSLARIYIDRLIASRRMRFMQTYSKLNLALELEW